jgi:hypothetical protein
MVLDMKKKIILIALLLAFWMFSQPIFAKTADEKIDDISKKIDDTNKKIADMWEKIKTSDVKIEFMGTEYIPNEPATIWLQLLRNYQPINDATCYVTVYYPNKMAFLNKTLMTYLSGSDGLFYYDLTTPSQLGVYMLTASCYIPANAWSDSFADYSKIEVYENITVSNSKAIISSFNQTSTLDYTDGTWESYETIGGINDTESVDFDLGDLSTINYIQLCYYASREKTTVLANVSVDSFITNYNLTFPVKAQPTEWFCTIVPKTIFSNGVNRIGLGCYKDCTSSDNTVIKVDLSSPNNNSYWWENSIKVWHLMNEDYAIKVIYNRTITNTEGYIRSKPIILNATFYWDEFKSTYDLKDGSINFKILNSTNSEICSGLGSILSCADSISPIKLYAKLTRPTGNSPEIDEWLVSWLPPTMEEIKGAGEMHISNTTAVINADINSLREAISSVNETQNINFQNLNQNMNSNFTYTNSLIVSLNSSINWWGNFLDTTINYWGNALETKIDQIVMGNVTVTALVDYDEIAITVMQYLKALQKQELI